MPFSSVLHQISGCLSGALGSLGFTLPAGFVLLYIGVVLPAVWSRHDYRRVAAYRTLIALLNQLDGLLKVLRARRHR